MKGQDTVMPQAYNPDDYLYCSALVRAKENLIQDPSGIERLIDAKTDSDLRLALTECGVEIHGGESMESALEGFLSDCYSMMRAISPSAGAVDVFALPYDANNIKAAVKCDILGRDATDMLYSYGTLQPDILLAAIREKDYSRLPENMAAAIPLAFSSYMQTRDPQLIDTCIDRACYLDISQAAQQSGSPFIREWVKIKTDLTNLLICIRIMRMSGEGDADYLSRMLMPGGSIPESFFTAAIGDSAAALWAALSMTEYSKIAEELDRAGIYTLAAIECEIENYCSDFVREKSKYALAGAEVLAGYIIACEYRVKNIRIILASGGGNAELRQRLRRV